MEELIFEMPLEFFESIGFPSFLAKLCAFIVFEALLTLAAFLLLLLGTYLSELAPPLEDAGMEKSAAFFKISGFFVYLSGAALGFAAVVSCPLALILALICSLFQ